jgi:arylsulfate sulfotransferase
MKSFFSVSLPLVVIALLTMCVLMEGCGAGSIPSLTGGSVTGTQNPLVAMYTIQTGCLGQMMVEFGPTTSYGRSTAWYPVTTTDDTSVEVAGMRASTTYHMRAQVQCSPGNGATSMSPDTTFTTGPLPSSVVFPQIVVSRPNPSLSSTENPGIEYINLVCQVDCSSTLSNEPPLFTDRDGNVIWYYDAGGGNFTFPFKLLPDGNILLNLTNAVTLSLLREVDLAGNTIREMSDVDLAHKMANATGFDFVPAGFTHDFLTLANGHVIVIVISQKKFTNLPGYPGTITVQGDALVDLDQNWNPVWAWNTFDHLDVNRHPGALPDWTHSNALIYSPDDGNLILSMRNQSWILKLDYNNGAGTGNILWTLGYQGDFALTDGGVPSDDTSLWFYSQHFPILLSQKGAQTTLGIWDNGDNRALNNVGFLCNEISGVPCYSRATIFQVDQDAKVANLVWAYPQTEFGIWGGAIEQFENGNVEFELNDPDIPPSPGVASYVQEVTDTSIPQVVWQMLIKPGGDTAYRAYRMPSLYNGVTWPY